MRHLYECPMRWADLDVLGHVNNVVYVDYLQEARVDMLRTHREDDYSGDLAEGVVVVRHEVTYLSPLNFAFEPVSIECWVTEIRAGSFTMAYEIFHDAPVDEGGRRVYLRATTLLTPFVFATEMPRRISPEERRSLERFLEPVEREPRRPRAPARRAPGGHYAVRVRFSDVDVFGHVNNVKYFEYLQEARLLLTSRVWHEIEPGVPRPSVVIAQADVDYRRPIVFREEAYDCWTSVTQVGARSMTVESEICDGETVLARGRVVVVFFDQETGRSTEPPAEYRDALLAQMPDAG